MLVDKLVFFSLSSWGADRGEVWRRNEIICAELHNRHKDLEILWVGQGPALWQRPESLSSIGRMANFGPDRPRIHSIDCPKLLPNVLGRQLNSWLTAEMVRNALSKLGWDRFAVWVNNQAVTPILPIPGSTMLVYDITDDWTVCPNLKEHQKQIIFQDDAWLLEHSDHVVVCSPGLLALKQGRCKDIRLIRNGADCSRLAPEKLSKLSQPPEFAAIGQPRAGYVGTLHEARLDVSLICEVAARLNNVQLVFIGPNHLSDSSKLALNQLPNCHILGQFPYRNLPEYMSGIDAWIAPHLINQFTESLDPIKLYEYAATGKPIVATSCAGFRECDSFVRLADGAQEFAKALDAALCGRDSVKYERQLAFARKHDWSSCVTAVEELLGWTGPP